SPTPTSAGCGRGRSSARRSSRPTSWCTSTEPEETEDRTPKRRKRVPAVAEQLPFLPSRRQMLRRCALGFGHLALAAMLAAEAAAATATPRPADPLAPKAPHFPARAKRLIFLFMKGGPSHLDTFDPKPLLDRDHGKPLPFAKPRVQFAQT